MENREGEYWLLLASTILEHRVEDLGVPGSNLLNALRPVLLMPRTAAWWAVREKVAQTTQATRLACVLHMGTHTHICGCSRKLLLLIARGKSSTVQLFCTAVSVSVVLHAGF